MKIKITLLFFILLVTVINPLAQATAPLIEGDETISITPNTYATLNWTVTDDNIKEYNLFLNDSTLISSDEWDDTNDGAAIKHDISIAIFVEGGLYNFELIVEDYDGLQSSFSTVVSLSGGSNGGDAPSSFIPLNMNYVLFGLIGIVLYTNKKRRSITPYHVLRDV